jgi:hypothetical protein
MSRANCGGFQERFDDDPADLASRLGDPAAQQAMAYVQGSLTTEMSALGSAIPLGCRLVHPLGWSAS